MASDLKRTEPASEASDRIRPGEDDLVAYWTFEEGSGYLVKDVTGNKHDLHIQQPPQWRVSYNYYSDTDTLPLKLGQIRDTRL